MNKLFKIFALAALAVLAGCLDTVQTYPENDTDVKIVSKASDLPECGEGNEGAQVYVKADSATRMCVAGKWQYVGTVYTNTIKANATCTVKNLKDSSGVKIICGGDSVGVIWNGVKGEQGNQGPQGDLGKTGATGDKGA